MQTRDQQLNNTLMYNLKEEAIKFFKYDKLKDFKNFCHQHSLCVETISNWRFSESPFLGLANPLLHVAIWYHVINIFKHLIYMGFPVNLTNQNNYNALHYITYVYYYCGNESRQCTHGTAIDLSIPHDNV